MGYGQGDHYIVVSIEIPKNLSTKERELYLQLAKLMMRKLKKMKAFQTKLVEKQKIYLINKEKMD